MKLPFGSRQIVGYSISKRPARNNWNDPMFQVFLTREGARQIKPRGQLYRVVLTITEEKSCKTKKSGS